jgi:hypothetical protein
MHERGLWRQGGATAGFSCFVAVHRPSRAGVALARNSGDPVSTSVHAQGVRLLSEVVKGRQPQDLDFDAVYAGAPSWDIGRPQAAMLALSHANAWRGKVLDIGCGTGEHALLAADIGLDATGATRFQPPSPRRFGKRPTGGSRHDSSSGTRSTSVDLGPSKQWSTPACSTCSRTSSACDTSRAWRRPPRLGGACYLLCFSELEAGGWPPRRVSEVEIRTSFSEGWDVDWVRPATFELAGAGPTNGARAWLAKIDRRSGGA